MSLMEIINQYAWVAGNLLIAYIAACVFFFVVAYYILFDPSATTAGRMIFRFFLSLVGVIGLNFIGAFVDPIADIAWSELPSGVEAWRPILRFVVYSYLAYSITSLAILLALRKWWPKRLRTYDDYELVKLRQTGELKTHKH